MGAADATASGAVHLLQLAARGDGATGRDCFGGEY